jgi:ferredoxin
MTIELDKTLCVGCGLCEENVPEIFKTGEYTAELKTSEAEESLSKRLKETAEDCPVDAITIYEKSF